MQDEDDYQRYLHLDSMVVKKGDRVRAGQLIGYSGDTGSGGAHLHYEDFINGKINSEFGKMMSNLPLGGEQLQIAASDLSNAASALMQAAGATAQTAGRGAGASSIAGAARARGLAPAAAYGSEAGFIVGNGPWGTTSPGPAGAYGGMYAAAFADDDLGYGDYGNYAPAEFGGYEDAGEWDQFA
jgi:hypothetical protein